MSRIFELSQLVIPVDNLFIIDDYYYRGDMLLLLLILPSLKSRAIGSQLGIAKKFGEYRGSNRENERTIKHTVSTYINCFQEN